jgi:hypothetical protein
MSASESKGYIASRSFKWSSRAALGLLRDVDNSDANSANPSLLDVVVASLEHVDLSMST